MPGYAGSLNMVLFDSAPAHVAERIRAYTSEQIASLTGYCYLLDAAHAL